MSTFTASINQFSDKTVKNIDQVVRKATYELFSSIAFKSPVDTGLFVGNWQFSNNVPKTGTLDVLDKTKSFAKSQAANSLQAKSGGKVYFSNNLPYAVPLEYGHSKQKAPAGMVRISIREFNANLEKLARQL